MTAFEMPDWGGMVVPDMSLVESFVRASLVYFGILILFRVVLTRQTGAMGLPDVMLAVLVSECVSQALGAQAKSIPNGLVSVAALLFWSYLFDRLGGRWKWFERLLEPPPVPLMHDGEVLSANMGKQGITDDELASQLREHGIEDRAKVKSAILESDGCISVVEADDPAMTEVREILRSLRNEMAELRAAVKSHDPMSGK